MAVSVLWLFLMVPWFVLQCVIVAFPGHTLFDKSMSQFMIFWYLLLQGALTRDFAALRLVQKITKLRDVVQVCIKLWMHVYMT